MSLLPAHGTDTVFEGRLDYRAGPSGNVTIEDSYNLRVSVQADRPHGLPRVCEIGGRIAHTADNHINPDGSLCLGSPLHVRVEAGREPTLLAFIDRCVIPFLYAASQRAAGDEGFAFGELPHGESGLLQDYEEAFGVQGVEEVSKVLQLLAKKRRIGNKESCPCGCGCRLGRCGLHVRLNRYRAVAPRSFFASLWRELPRG